MLCRCMCSGRSRGCVSVSASVSSGSFIAGKIKAEQTRFCKPEETPGTANRFPESIQTDLPLSKSSPARNQANVPCRHRLEENLHACLREGLMPVDGGFSHRNFTLGRGVNNRNQDYGVCRVPAWRLAVLSGTGRAWREGSRNDA